MWNWKFGNENFELKIWGLKKKIENFEFEFLSFFLGGGGGGWLIQLSLTKLTLLLAEFKCGVEILVPYFFVSPFFPFLLHLHQLFFLD